MYAAAWKTTAGAVLVEDLPHLLAVLDVAEDRGGGVVAALVDELALDLEQIRLGVVEEHEPRGADARDLPAELRADRSARAGDEHDLAGQVARDRGDVDLDRLAAEHVLHLDRAQLARQVEVAGDELGETRQRLHRHALAPRRVHDPLAHFAGRRGDRDQQLVGPVLAQHLGQLVRRAEHPHAVQAHVLLAPVVVDEPDRRVAERRVAEHLLDDQLRGVARADDDRLLAARDDAAGSRSLEDRAREQARTGHERETEQQVDEPDALRHACRVQLEEREDEEDGQRGEHHTADCVPHVARRDVAPPAVVEAARQEDGELERDDQQDDVPGQVAVVVHRPLLFEAKLPREPPRGGDQYRVDREAPHLVPVRPALSRQAATPAAARTVSTTRSCTSAEIPPHIGSARLSAAARSVSGSEPGCHPKSRSAGCRCVGTT